MSWHGRLDSLLYDGETIVERFEVADSELVVTSHRVLAFAPDADGKPFRQVDRPNVAGVRAELQGRPWTLLWATGVGLLGAALVFLSALVDFTAPVGVVDGESPIGVPGAEEAIGVLEVALTMVDHLVLASGLLACLVSLGLFGLYLYSRERVLVVAVYGEPDIELPVTAETEAIVPELAAAIEPGPGSVDEVGSSGQEPVTIDGSDG